jgi:hypothetical protein
MSCEPQRASWGGLGLARRLWLVGGSELRSTGCPSARGASALGSRVDSPRRSPKFGAVWVANDGQYSESTPKRKYIEAIADAYPDEAFVQKVLAQITWYHPITLLENVTGERHGPQSSLPSALRSRGSDAN